MMQSCSAAELTDHNVNLDLEDTGMGKSWANELPVLHPSCGLP